MIIFGQTITPSMLDGSRLVLVGVVAFSHAHWSGVERRPDTTLKPEATRREPATAGLS